MKVPIPKEYFKTSDLLYKGRKIRTYRFGNGPRKVLSLPGFPHSGLIYLYFLKDYDLNKVTFVTLDLPGWIGDSENVFDNSDYEEDEVVDILKHVVISHELEKDSFGLIGYSFGSSLAARLVGLSEYNINRLALVSPVLHGKEIEERRWLLNAISTLKAYRYLKMHIVHRFRIYKARLKLLGVDPAVINQYSEMIQNADPRILFESINVLFTNEYLQYLKNFNPDNILIASSKDESKYLRDQAAYLRRELNGENTLYLHGGHEDFIVNPSHKVVGEIMNFLIDQ